MSDAQAASATQANTQATTAKEQPSFEPPRRNAGSAIKHSNPETESKQTTSTPATRNHP